MVKKIQEIWHQVKPEPTGSRATLLVCLDPRPPAFYGALFSSRFALAVCFSLLSFSSFPSSYRINLIVYLCCPAPVVWLDLPIRLSQCLLVLLRPPELYE